MALSPTAMGLVELPSGNSISLFVEAASGHDQRPPIFFIHGLSNDHTVFANLIASLSSRMRIAYDLPGHGLSPLYSPLDLATLVHDCQALLCHAGVEDEVDIVAHSGGTVIALALAATLGARVRTLVLLGAPALPMPNLEAAAAAFRAGGPGAILAAQVGAVGAEARHDRSVRQALEKMVLEQVIDGPCAIL